MAGLAALPVLSASLHAQGVRVEIVEESTREPIAGAIVTLLDSRGIAVAEGLTSASGHRLLAAPSAGAYRILVRRVGYIPYTSPALTLPEGEAIGHRLSLIGQRVVLPRVVSTADRRCRTNPARNARSAVLWDEIGKALIASELTRADGQMPVQRRTVERVLNRDGRVREERWSTWVTTMETPFIARAPADFLANGYLINGSGKAVNFRSADSLLAETHWDGPDATVLLSDEFQSEHCFAVVEGRGGTAGLIGLEFTPSEGRRLVDIAGTLWIDRQTAELRFVEYRYVNTKLPRSARGAGGRIAFSRLPSGEWIVSEWVIRTPSVQLDRLRSRTRLVGWLEVGGEAGPARVGGVAGVTFDSLVGRPLAGTRISLADGSRSTVSDESGRYVLDSVLPGEYALQFAHPLLDSLGAPFVQFAVAVAPGETARRDFGIPSHASFRSTCPAAPLPGPDSGMAIGAMRFEGSGDPAARMVVAFTWNPVASDSLAALAPVSVVAATNEEGIFIACGLPVGVPITAEALTEQHRPARRQLVIGERAIHRIELRLAPLAGDAVSEPAAPPPASPRPAPPPP